MMINLTDMKTVRSILGRHGFHFSKKLGQNFLIDSSVCPRIARRATLRQAMVCWRSVRVSAP